MARVIIQIKFCCEDLNIYGILPKGPYPPCLRMADGALLAGYPRSISTQIGLVIFTVSLKGPWYVAWRFKKRPQLKMRYRQFFSRYIGRQMNVMASQITGHLVACLTTCAARDQREHQTSALLVFCEGNALVMGGFPSQRFNNGE